MLERDQSTTKSTRFWRNSEGGIQPLSNHVKEDITMAQEKYMSTAEKVELLKKLIKGCLILDVWNAST